MQYLSAFAVGRFHVLGLRQPSAQERVFLCVRGRSSMRVVNACAHLFEHGDFTVRPEVLEGVANLDDIDVPAWRFLCSACKCTCTSLPLRETRCTGDTNVDIGLAGCRLLGRLRHCLPRSDVSFEFGLAHALAANNIVLSIASISRAAGETATAHASTFGTPGAVNSSFARLVATPNVWISVEALFLTGLATQTDGLTVTQLHASRMLRTIWPLLHQVRCSTQSFQNRAHRWSKVVSHCLRANIKPPLFGL